MKKRGKVYTIELPDTPSKKKTCFGYVKEPYRSKNPILRILDFFDFGLPYRPWWVFVGILMLPLLIPILHGLYFYNYISFHEFFHKLTGFEGDDFGGVYLFIWIPYWSILRTRRNCRLEMFICSTYQNWGRVIRYCVAATPIFAVFLYLPLSFPALGAFLGGFAAPDILVVTIFLVLVATIFFAVISEENRSG